MRAWSSSHAVCRWNESTATLELGLGVGVGVGLGLGLGLGLGVGVEMERVDGHLDAQRLGQQHRRLLVRGRCKGRGRRRGRGSYPYP